MSPSDHHDPEGSAPIARHDSHKSKAASYSDDAQHAETQSIPPVDKVHGGLHRGLSARQVSMIAIAGTIGTGLFLGTGRSLAQGGPASMLLCYGIVGFIVYITLLLLGEMATQYPIAGELSNRLIRALRPWDVRSKAKLLPRASALYARSQP